MASQDTEITLGTGKMLALFFGLVALNGAFFGMGYSLGRTSSHPSLSADQAQSINAPAIRPSVSKSGSATNNGQTDTSNLTFYKTVEQKDANAQLPAAKGSGTASNGAPSASSESKQPEAKPTDAAPDAATVLSTSNYFVQVAAVSKQDDAQALVDALKKKQYTAFATNTSPTDKLYHVQVGPFGDVKDAEATKAKLVSDGYNPILKK